jgi:hypothetical protein
VIFGAVYISGKLHSLGDLANKSSENNEPALEDILPIHFIDSNAYVTPIFE